MRTAARACVTSGCEEGVTEDEGEDEGLGEPRDPTLQLSTWYRLS